MNLSEWFFIATDDQVDQLVDAVAQKRGVSKKSARDYLYQLRVGHNDAQCSIKYARLLESITAKITPGKSVTIKALRPDLGDLLK